MSLTPSSPTLTIVNQNPLKPPRHVSLSSLPPELILQIYTHVPAPSSIRTLNLTCRFLYHVWYENACTISGAVLSRSLDHYDILLELCDLDRAINHSVAWKSQPHATRLVFFAVAQKQARAHVAEASRKGYRGPSSSHVLLRTVTHRNERLLKMARSAAHACILYEEPAARQTTSTAGPYASQPIKREELLAAYYGIWILSILSYDTVPLERVKATSKRELEAMLTMTRYLLGDCPDAEKCRLGIAHLEFRRGLEGSGEEEGRRVCVFDSKWWFAFRTVSVALYRQHRGTT
ncbi:MAG: hypothetical protein ASARMPRED_002813 [Alectoria sarmentosa]|nr:MAG: hypothetical protein ASARMPRED_002813 [Alectoria sarmentosa]